MRILVIGGGVSGLTTATTLAREGWQVTVVAREWAPHIVSSVAAAIWHPFRAEHPRVAEWAQSTLEMLDGLSERPETGVRWVEGVQLHRRPTPHPEFTAASRPHRTLAPGELPPGYVTGFAFPLPVIETPIYMDWLREEARRCGVAFQSATIRSLEEATAIAPLVVNCSGLGARELAADTSMVPIRGQILRLAPGHLDTFLFDEDDADQPTYLIPRSDGLIVGGTAIYGDWDQSVRQATSEAILERARRLVPALRDLPVLEALVGLRPGRPTVRLEAERLPSGDVIHNYGHGGSGFTLSWGCAAEVAALAAALAGEERR